MDQTAAAVAACRAASARWRESSDRRARRRRGGDSQRTRSSPHCRCRTPAADTALAVPRAARAPASSLRSARFAPTPPATTSVFNPVCVAARAHFATSVSTTACWNSRRRRRASARRAARPRIATTTAVFRPLKLKSSPGRSSIGRGNWNLPGRPLSRQLGQRRTAGIRQAEQLGGLVERLARGIVQRCAEVVGSYMPAAFILR